MVGDDLVEVLAVDFGSSTSSTILIVISGKRGDVADLADRPGNDLLSVLRQNAHAHVPSMGTV